MVHVVGFDIRHLGENTLPVLAGEASNSLTGMKMIIGTVAMLRRPKGEVR
jgi:hypothetical protein